MVYKKVIALLLVVAMLLTTIAAAEPTTFSQFSPIIVGGFLLGGWNDKSWLSEDEAFSLINDKELYKIYYDGHYTGSRAGVKVSRQWEHGAAYGSEVELLPDDAFEVSAESHNAEFVMISSNRNIGIRDVLKLSNENAIYAQIVDEYVASLGYPGLNLDIVDLYRVDIDGDGVFEVLISANNYHNTSDQEHIGSVLFMRRVNERDQIVEVVEIAEWFYPFDEFIEGNKYGPIDNRYNIVGFYDLNCDGKLEIIIEFITNRSNHFVVFELQGNELVEVLSNGNYFWD